MSIQSNHSAVGYGRPPAHTRFRPGQSGNPKGRPSGKKAMTAADPMEICGTLLRKILMEKVILSDNDRNRRVSKLDAILRGMVAKAINRDIRAAGRVLELLSVTSQAATDGQNSSRLDARDTGIQVTFVRPRSREGEES